MLWSQNKSRLIYTPAPVNRYHSLNERLVLWMLVMPPNRDGGSIWYDLVAGQNGTLTSLAAGSGWFQTRQRPGAFGSFQFAESGLNGYVSVPAIAALGSLGTMSIACWVYVTNAGTSGRIVTSGDTNPFALMFNNATSLQFDINGTFKNITVNAYSNAWNHFIAAWDKTSPGTVSIYQNGVPIGTATGLTSSTNAAQTIAIGNRTTGTRGWNGYIDDFRIWTKTLNAAEALQVYRESYQGHPETLIRLGSRRPVMVRRPTGAAALLPAG